MNSIKKSNLNKKVWSIIFTLCMLVFNLPCLPVDKALAIMNHNVKITGYNTKENEEFIYNIDGFKAGSIKLENTKQKPQTDSYVSLQSGTYKVTVNVSNGYSFKGIKINDEYHSSNEFEMLNSNTYSYNLNLSTNIKDAEILAEFMSNVISNSERKIYVGNTLCIDESAETPITHYSGANFDIYPSETVGDYTVDLKSNAYISNIVADKNTNITIKTHGNATIDAKDGLSIQGIRKLTIFDENSSDEVLNLKGGIDFSDSVSINKNTHIKSDDKGIICSGTSENSSISIQHSTLSVDASSAFENIKGNISVGSKGTLNITCSESPFKNTNKVLLTDGGVCQIHSKSDSLNSKIYSSWINSEENNILNSNPKYTEKEINWLESSEEVQRQNNYLCGKSETTDPNGYYTWNVKSLSPSTNLFLYGKNVAGETLNVVNGDVEILSAEGVNQDKDFNTKSGNYKIKSGSEITLRLTPKCGYQLNKNILSGAIAQDEKCVYKFTMPDYNLCLNDIFVKNDHNVVINSNQIKNVSVDIPDGVISGNGCLTINSLENVSNEENFKDKAENFDISNYFDFSLEEIIFKNGDSSKEGWKTPITNLNKPIDITLELGDSLKGKKRYCVLREHEGEVDNLNGIYSSQNSTIKFNTDKFSSYALGSSDTVRTLTKTVKYNNKELTIIIEDPNNSLSDTAELSVTLVAENTDRYKILQNQLDDTHKIENIVFFDIVIYKDSTHAEKYSQLQAPVNVFFEIPEGWDKDDLQAVLVADGVDGEFEEEVVTRDNKEFLSFSTDHFSPYAFLDELSEEELKNLSLDDLNLSDEDDDYQEPVTEEDTTPYSNEEEDNTPFTNMVTGDRARNVIIYAAVAVAISLAAILFLKKKKPNE